MHIACSVHALIAAPVRAVVKVDLDSTNSLAGKPDAELSPLGTETLTVHLRSTFSAGGTPPAICAASASAWASDNSGTSPSESSSAVGGMSSSQDVALDAQP